jgi:16S rRNA (adenine1518-N6/adenine1519-N6)-dimethyltransferase
VPTLPRYPKEQLAALGLRPKHHFGQNFLADEGLAKKIAALCTPHDHVTVVEIGAGLGALTGPLLERARRVVAVERDRDLVPALTRRFASEMGDGRLVVLEADAKTVDLFADIESDDDVVVAGNLPYQITGPLLERLCTAAARVLKAVVLVQLEVAARLAANPGTGDYGALSVFVQAHYEPVRRFLVRRGAFYPQPNVDSAVVELVPRRPPLAQETPLFKELVHRAFQQRRKQLRNAWRSLEGASPAEIERASRMIGIDLEQRGESLSVSQFWQLTQALEGE